MPTVRELAQVHVIAQVAGGEHAERVGAQEGEVQLAQQQLAVGRVEGAPAKRAERWEVRFSTAFLQYRSQGCKQDANGSHVSIILIA